MSKKIIGPALPPHLQHLVQSRHSEGEQDESSKSSKFPHSRTPNNSVEDDDEDDSVLVLHVSDDELLAEALEGPNTIKQSSNTVSSNFRSKRDVKVSDSSDDEDMFGPTLPPDFKAGAKKAVRKSSDDEDEDPFTPSLPPNIKPVSRSDSTKKPEVSDDDDSFGPVLPPDYKTDSRRQTSRSSDEGDSFGPVLPPDFKIRTRSRKSNSSSEEDNSFGPVLPPDFKIQTRSRKSDSSSEEDDSFGPVLPPDFKTGARGRSSDRVDSFGPALPPDFKADSGSAKVIGPTLPPSLQPHVGEESLEPGLDSDDDVVGPMPPMQDSGVSASYVQQQLEARALKMKRKLAGEDDDSTSRVVARETWMLELPPDRSSEFGLGPRQFRARAKLDLGDRSVWTDTPVDKELRATAPDSSAVASTVDLKSEREMLAIAERDRAMQRMTDKHNKKKKRKESLVDLHQKKLKKKQKKEEEDGKPKERRPFDRNLDLQANRFDEAQKKAILKKAQLLDDRFSRGESKFL